MKLADIRTLRDKNDIERHIHDILTAEDLVKDAPAWMQHYTSVQNALATYRFHFGEVAGVDDRDMSQVIQDTLARHVNAPPANVKIVQKLYRVYHVS